MGVWIDPPAWPAHGRLYAHLVTDADLAELHAVAAAAGVSPRAFDGDHYDVPERLWHAAVAAGARPTSAADLVARLNASGLRLRKRKGDRGMARLLDMPTPLGVSAVDVVRSHRPVRVREMYGHAELTASGGAWGVRLSLGRRGREWADPVGYLRLGILDGANVIQAYRGSGGAEDLPMPWNLLV